MNGPAVTRPTATVDEAGLARVHQRLVDGVIGAVDGTAAGSPVEVTLPLLRRARTRPETVGLAEPAFTWKPAFARRSLGLAAVRACAAGRFRGPADAVGPLAAEAVDEWRRTGWRTFHWEPWFAGLGSGARAVVLAEAVTWSTPLWASADWAALGPRAVVGGADDLWTCPGPRTVRLKGRCEARVACSGAPAPGPASGGALVSVSGGSPGPGALDELAYLALVAGVRSPGEPPPARVVGLWPESGESLTAHIDEEALGAAADRVVEVVALVAGPDRSAVGSGAVAA